MLFKRKNIVICSMILLLFVVGYAYNMFTTDNYIGVNYDLEMDQPSPSAFEEITGNLDTPAADIAATAIGEPASMDKQSAAVIEQDPAAVEASSSAAATFFSEYRMERDKNRSKEVAMWQEIISNQNTEKTFKNLAQEEIVKVLALTEKEMIIEQLVMSLGFSDALVFLTEDSATVLVETKELTSADVAKVQDILIRKTKFSPANIKIMKKD
ncbi:MAG TPA: SpoIIIAH-like family protein [Patescibacteria group bacterium]|nr:SpoIIIAH-like family protein [Patescibacteria group bacterium]